ncbi:MAG: hypothetical protein OEW58_05195 [Gammaproteobacteria bacterium]|nr:hypothetical protein [Gammaproteobacteria bacterium]
MTKRLLTAVILSTGLFSLSLSGAHAANVNLNSPQWLGGLKLEKNQLKDISKAVEKALSSPIDASQQCGASRQDCEVRAAREWTVEGDLYREIVINVHTVGHASSTVKQDNGKWPAIVAQ